MHHTGASHTSRCSRPHRSIRQRVHVHALTDTMERPCRAQIPVSPSLPLSSDPLILSIYLRVTETSYVLIQSPHGLDGHCRAGPTPAARSSTWDSRLGTILCCPHPECIGRGLGHRDRLALCCGCWCCRQQPDAGYHHARDRLGCPRALGRWEARADPDCALRVNLSHVATPGHCWDSCGHFCALPPWGQPCSVPARPWGSPVLCPRGCGAAPSCARLAAVGQPLAVPAWLWGNP